MVSQVSPRAPPSSPPCCPTPAVADRLYCIRRAEKHVLDVAYEWEEETKVVDPAVYQQAAKDGIVTCLAFGAKIPKKWAKQDGTVFGGIKAEQWDGL